jgi:predicted O-methyltransferase YrrM
MRQSCDHDLDIYNHDCCNDGHSSLLLARGAGEFHTVDINSSNSNLTTDQLKKFGFYNKSTVYNGDGLILLKQFKKPIDLLYLDAWDVELPLHAEKHLEAFELGESKLAANAVILIDDTDVGYSEERGYHNDEESLGGKGRLLIPYLLSKTNYEMIFKGRQTCFKKLD